MIDRLHDGRITEDSRLGHWAFPFAEMRALSGAGGGRGDGILKLLTQEGRDNPFMKLGCSVLLRRAALTQRYLGVNQSHTAPCCFSFLFHL